MRRPWIALVVLVLSASARPAHAGDAFAYTDPSDELSLARAADAAGDAALAAALQGDRYEAVLAIRASEYARAPELLIAALAVHACGRDPTLAPEAAATLRKLAQRLTPSALAEREVLRSDLDRARAALRCARAPLVEVASALDELAAALAP